ncbi:MAG: hypothetical protein AAF993_21170, partial [Pseudomonadota bacterium]
FQEDYQGALLNALVAEAQQRRGDSPVRFQLAEGSFAFADGMYSYANELFNAVPAEELTELDQMRLAFHLAREYHRRQDWPSLEAQLAKIDLGKTWLLQKQKSHPEVEFMRAESAVQLGEFDRAREHFALMDENHPLKAYGLFNLGVAYRDAQQLDAAQQTFRELADITAYDDEAFDLSQRAKLALALIARQRQDTQTAESVLSDLPSEGRYQEVAMAAFGGLAMDNQDYELAARIWMTLQQQAYWTPSTATARLGFPLSLEKMSLANSDQGQGGRQLATTQMALHQYQQAEQSFTSRLQNLVALNRKADDPAWIQDLLVVFASEEQDEAQMQALMRNWQLELGHTDWLEWLATDQIHQALSQWRELNQMQSWLDQLPESLAALEGVAQEQKARNQQAGLLLHDDGLYAQRERLQQQIQQQQKTLSDIAASQPQMTHAWMVPLANAEERETLQRLQTMRTQLVHMEDADRRKWEQRVERLEGMFFYRLVAEQAARTQVLNRQLRELQELLVDVDDRVARVSRAEENFVTGVGATFSSFLDRATVITAQVDTARTAREALLAREIRGRMQQEMLQVEQYLLVTRIAIARATDQLALVGDRIDQPDLQGEG